MANGGRTRYRRRAMLRANLGLLVTVFTWGSMIPCVAIMVPRWDPFFLTSSRYVVAGPVFLLILVLAESSRGLGRALVDGHVWLLGAVGIGFFGPLLIVGYAYTNPVTAAVLAAMAPAINAAVARVGFRQPLDRSSLPAIGLALAGGVIATYDPDGADGPFALRGGEVLIIGATVCWAWYSLAAQRWLAGWSQMRIAGTTIATGSVVSVMVYILVALVGLAPLRPTVPLSSLDLGLFAWMTGGPVILSFFLWHYAVHKLGFVVASLFINLTPVIAILLTAVMLGIYPTALQLLGGALVLAGVLQSQLRHLPLRPRRAVANPEPPG
jgi:drug/metabolite transporter (DMT)-like permease